MRSIAIPAAFSVVLALSAASPALLAQSTPSSYSPKRLDAPQVAPVPSPTVAGVPLGLQAALQRALAENPELVAMRQELCVSAQAWEVARHLPTSLNPTVAIISQPWVFQRSPDHGVEQLPGFVSVELSQPLEFGHRTALRASIARAQHDQTGWKVVQSELSVLVQTYRRYQTAAYRREKLRTAGQLADFNQTLLQTLRRQLEANQVPAADVVLAEVENQATRQRVETARQEYADALAELRQEIGTPEYAASAEPADSLTLPEAAAPPEEDALVIAAMESRPELHAAQADVDRARAAVCLARADRIPIPSVGPAYERNESGASFYGVTLSSPVPLLNTGTPLVAQREAEYHQAVVTCQQTQQRIITQVKATLARWSQARQLALRTASILEPIQTQAARMQRLYEAGQTDLVKLLQVRQRLIEASNAQLDAIWTATQAYADLLAALGGGPLQAGLRD